MPYLIATIAEHERRCLDRMESIIVADDFSAMSGEELGMYSPLTCIQFSHRFRLLMAMDALLHIGSTTPLSSSMVSFYTVMLQFVNNICLIGSLTVSCMRSIGCTLEKPLDAVE